MADTYSTILNKQVRNAFALQHSMSETDQLLFHMPLQDQLNDSWALTITTDHHILFPARITSNPTPD
eukprot:15344053-Ditylum_brightwellii.AAC.1